MMTQDPYELAWMINGMKPGEWLKISQCQIADLRGRMFESGWEVVLQNVIGSDHRDIWSFDKDEFGDMLVKRHDEMRDTR